MKRFLIIISMALCFFIGRASSTVYAWELSSLVKGGVVSAAVYAMADTINSGINLITGKLGAENKQITKVVPIITLGDAARVGAVQVSGPEERVQECEAALLLDKSITENIRAKIFIPVNSVSVTNVKRVQGVGVAAIIDIKI